MTVVRVLQACRAWEPDEMLRNLDAIDMVFKPWLLLFCKNIQDLLEAGEPR